ncbi:hypothetical protein niasHS_015663 [Heterodera schachtii]|uniref:FATC domain-containing protein n=1 Tax=Heterodera schachtii TaxID=97005 RepID=A0ABD2HYM6_HETSC
MPLQHNHTTRTGKCATRLNGWTRRDAVRTERPLPPPVFVAFSVHRPLHAACQKKYGGTTLQSQQQDNANHTIGMIKMRLSGQIITTRFNPPKACAVPMSVGGQLARLIEIATDDAKLSSMYIGWCTFT